MYISSHVEMRDRVSTIFWKETLARFGRVSRTDYVKRATIPDLVVYGLAGIGCGKGMEDDGVVGAQGGEGG